jgi:hypothetical protein
MQLLGYGEDALTLWVLTRRLDELLSRLGESRQQVLALFYRPSFGRRSAGPKAEPGTHGPQFGEFDGIIISQQRAIYLVEAKWPSSGELAEEKIILRPEQRIRHALLRAYLAAWRAMQPKSWEEFTARHRSFEIHLDGGTPRRYLTPEPRTRLASNLETVLRRCAEGGDQTHDVLLVVHPGEQGVLPERSGPDDFRVVEMRCPAMVEGYVVLDETV